MSVILAGLVIAVVILWQRIQRLGQRIAILESAGSRLSDAEWPASRPAPMEDRPPPQQRTVTIINRPPEPAPVEEPAPAEAETVLPPVPEPASQPRTIGFEELFGTKLPIWGGGITLAVAGLFIVKYSIDAGLLSPAVRVVLGLLFAAALVIGVILAANGHEPGGEALVTFTAAQHTFLAVVLVVTERRLWLNALMEGIPAAILLILML